MSKRSHVTDEDRALFRRVAGEVRRVEDDRVRPARSRRSPVGERRTARAGGTLEGLVDSDWTPEVAPGDVLSFAREGVRRRDVQRLRRGRFEIEADLDLHGRIVADAIPALSRFLEESCRLRRQCVRIVHGKGFGSPGGRAVMKANVDRWLRARPEVLAFCSATPPDGGTGALYVLLKR